jgi:Rrf2 family protein
MKLTKRGEYALRALIDLAIAPQAGRQMLSQKEIAAKENIPLPFLEQIFLQLREAGLVDGKRGKGGGFFLAKPANNITLAEVVRLIDGPLAPISCASMTAYAKCGCPDEAHCGLRMIMLDVRNSISNILDRYTLAQVAEVTIRKMVWLSLSRHRLLRPSPSPTTRSEQRAKWFAARHRHHPCGPRTVQGRRRMFARQTKLLSGSTRLAV